MSPAPPHSAHAALLNPALQGKNSLPNGFSHAWTACRARVMPRWTAPDKTGDKTKFSLPENI
jgi:hypothetical protein